MSTATAQTPPHAAFAARLKSARLRSGKSQELIALEVGTSRRHWIRWEGGWHLPSQLYIVRIADATGQPTEFLTGTPASPSDEDDDEESDPVADLMHALEKYVDHRLARVPA